MKAITLFALLALVGCTATPLPVAPLREPLATDVSPPPPPPPTFARVRR